NFEPLHDNRSGFRDAGLWLAEHAHPGDEILDPYCWAHYYAGQVFEEGKANEGEPGHKPLRYVVLELSGNLHLRLNEIPTAKRLAAQGQKVFEWQGKRNRDRCIVSVYACPIPDVTGQQSQEPKR